MTKKMDLRDLEVESFVTGSGIQAGINPHFTQPPSDTPAICISGGPNPCGSNVHTCWADCVH